MKLTTVPLKQIHLKLKDLGIKSDYKVSIANGEKFLLVDRTSMCHAFECDFEHENYDKTLDVIRSLYPDLYIIWAGKTDDDLGVECYIKD